MEPGPTRGFLSRKLVARQIGPSRNDLLVDALGLHHWQAHCQVGQFCKHGTQRGRIGDNEPSLAGRLGFDLDAVFGPIARRFVHQVG